jgi:hypothetical protein
MKHSAGSKSELLALEGGPSNFLVPENSVCTEVFNAERNLFHSSFAKQRRSNDGSRHIEKL